jgi:hypothetical protein
MEKDSTVRDFLFVVGSYPRGWAIDFFNDVYALVKRKKRIRFRLSWSITLFRFCRPGRG